MIAMSRTRRRTQAMRESTARYGSRSPQVGTVSGKPRAGTPHHVRHSDRDATKSDSPCPRGGQAYRPSWGLW